MDIDGDNDETFGLLRMRSRRLWRLGHELGALAVLITIGLTLGTVDSQQELGDAIVSLSISLPLVYGAVWGVVRLIDWVKETMF
ncbi:MAG: hypothetical protein BRD55_10270 [Bacteroidetes bacterium SW_9_63_38]|nr:MAG: hypothetical protein BRD55_10270 [Bacteroidetes bacterium SW_9_63_38]